MTAQEKKEFAQDCIKALTQMVKENQTDNPEFYYSTMQHCEATAKDYEQSVSHFIKHLKSAKILLTGKLNLKLESASQIYTKALTGQLVRNASMTETQSGM